MFKRYTEHTRRVLFWAPEEAGKAGSDYVEPERPNTILGEYGVHLKDARQVILDNSNAPFVGSRPNVAPKYSREGALLVNPHEITLIERLKLSDGRKYLELLQLFDQTLYVLLEVDVAEPLFLGGRRQHPQ